MKNVSVQDLRGYVVGEEASSMGKRTVEGKLDTCGSVSLSTLLTYRMSKIAGNMVLRRLFSQV